MTGIISSQTNIRNVREEHCHLIPKDHGVYPIPGDGSCFFGSLAAHIYQDETQVSILRRLCHYFMVENWWYFQFFIPLPFMETVGVGAESYRICLDTEEEFKRLFLSDDSLTCFSNSQVDIAIVANLFNMNIGVFTYGSEGLSPSWSWTSPDPLLREYSVTSCHDSILDALLYKRIMKKPIT